MGPDLFTHADMQRRHAPGDAVAERRGINSIQLYKGEEGWKIIHMIWDNERPGRSVSS